MAQVHWRGGEGGKSRGGRNGRNKEGSREENEKLDEWKYKKLIGPNLVNSSDLGEKKKKKKHVVI